ncbi:DUF4912 domain-containing protein [Synechococcus sp. Nb3U1]|uniref:DUF4912 domain-containing protein n=1 Tax=Synechococcus sp. Nb3U1 TaxID=1914529 RepID=UPI001F30CBE6|nr:DUF4912 domain-containing protein [Synechococcus sp. Nb3U1]MCF2972318.1 DUF4912 domain-containing protein [Synechococcus sp. Nb3U1]
MPQERIPLEEMTIRQLREEAARYEIPKYSRMTKDQLVLAIREAQTVRSGRPTDAMPEPRGQEPVSGAKFNSQTDTKLHLADVDQTLGDLPGGYGESRIVLLPRDPQWAYTYWDVPNDAKESKRREGGQQLALRLYDVTDIDFNYQSAHSMQEYPCDELAREWYLPIPVSDRSYIVEIGYRAGDGRWLVLARSAAVAVPPVYPSDWFEEQFLTVPFDMALQGRTLYQLNEPYKRSAGGLGVVAYKGNEPQQGAVTDRFFEMVGGFESMRVAGSLFGSHQMGSRQMLPEETLSSFVIPSGVGMMSMSMAEVPAAPWMASGSGLGLFSGASEVMPQRSRKFWLVADAELIVYGATEPDATVTIGGRQIQLNPDGTFRFHMAFPDGNIDFPIFAVAADGEQNREIHLTFDRSTLARRTNTKEEAVEELLP